MPHPTVAPGCRGLKNPAAISPVWREQPARSAALALLPGVGLRVYSLSQRQGRLSLLPHAQPVPGNKGTTATPTAAVVVALLAQGAMGHVLFDAHEGVPGEGMQPPHWLSCDALGLDHAWYDATAVQKIAQFNAWCEIL